MSAHILDQTQIRSFIDDGFVRIEQAFSRQTAEECCDILWRASGCNPRDPATWTSPVVRLGYYSEPPFVAAVNTPVLHHAFDQLVGQRRWFPRADLGSFVIRFPHADQPVDTGWHVDASFPGADPTDAFAARINVVSRGRALLMLFLLTDAGEDDAPTRLRRGSHCDVARILAPKGEAGLSFMELASELDKTADRPLALATGKAGDVYLCHPFLAHAAQAHHGERPRIIAQPPLHLREPLRIGDHAETSPVEQAIGEALRRT